MSSAENFNQAASELRFKFFEYEVICGFEGRKFNFYDYSDVHCTVYAYCNHLSSFSLFKYMLVFFRFLAHLSQRLLRLAYRKGSVTYP